MMGIRIRSTKRSKGIVAQALIAAWTLGVLSLCGSAHAQCSGTSCQIAHQPSLQHDVIGGDCKSGAQSGSQPADNFTSCSGGGGYYYSDWERTLTGITHDVNCVSTVGQSCIPCGLAPGQNHSCANKPRTYASTHYHQRYNAMGGIMYTHTWTTTETQVCACGTHGCTN